ncbi:MAG: hypothetical protein RL160_363, partial [Bacteroidota bacterium]
AGPPTQTKNIGDIDWNSSDLEFGYESSTTDPQLVGLRFTNIGIPKGSLITNAYIQFTVDATSKNADPCRVVIRMDPAANSAALDSNKFHLSKRAKSADSIVWNVADKTKWATVGLAGVDQRTPNLAALLQQTINNESWVSGNAVSFFLQGTGTREVESYDGDAPKAPLLVIEYIPAVTVSVRINNAFDDLEEWIAGPPTQTKNIGEIDWNSSDLEFGYESSTTDPQLVGLRFNGIGIPRGSRIVNSYIQFTVDATSKNADPCEVNIRVEPSDNAAPLDSNKFHLTKRTQSTDSVFWKVSDKSTWATVGLAGINQRTPSLNNLVQSLVNRNGWNSGNSMAFFMKGKGTREVESFDGDAPKAPLLVITYIPMITKSVRINNAFDDLEEWIAGPPTQTKNIGEIDWNSSDLEFGYESSTTDPQLVGLRFNNIGVPKGAIMQNAYIQFTVDATSKNADPCEVNIRIEPTDNAAPLDSNKFHLTNRTQSTDSVLWKVSDRTTWGTVGLAGPNQRTPNLAGLMQPIINRSGWAANNSMAFYIKGKGTREVESFDGDAPKAPLLVMEYLGSADSTPGSSTGYKALPITNFPVTPGQSWNFWDKGLKPSTRWKDTLNNDTLWGQGAAPLGYGDAHIATTIGFGTNAAAKHITSWFRKTILVPSTSALSDTLELNIMHDDGAVVYINGNEVLRVNMPAGAIDSNTLSLGIKEGMQEMLYYSYDIPKTALRNGKNVIAVEVHQRSGNSSDLGFDLELKNRSMRIPPLGQLCQSANDNYISCFRSILPIDHVDSMTIPASHNFQSIFGQGDAYSVGGGVARGSNDFTGFIPKKGSSTEGWLSINHETSPGGVSMLDLHYDCNSGLWIVDSSRAIDFTTDIVLTSSNCSGGVTPWGTVVTCEETTGGSDVNNDGYLDLGWMIEIDPITKKVMKYGTGKHQKLWAMGRMSHENVCFGKDSLTAYYGEDAGAGNVWKFVADQKANMSSGKLYVLKLDSVMSNFEPRGSTGKWVLIPNTSTSERNNIVNAARNIGATAFSGVEDVEINPLDGSIYFTAKGNNRTYRFKENGSNITDFETYVGGRTYRINTPNGVIAEPWSGGNDNLTFDNRGNLYVLQDGGKDHIWVIKNGHTQANPKVEVFMTTPIGSEPTGMTFTPNEKFMFLSIQSPSTSNATVQKDAAGKNVVFNRATTIAIGLDQAFTPAAKTSIIVNDSTQCLIGNNFVFNNNAAARTKSSWTFGNGQSSTLNNPLVSYTTTGTAKVTLNTEDLFNGCKSTANANMTILPSPAKPVITGNISAAQGSTEPYSVVAKTGSYYNWNITGGNQESGGKTASITVKWSQIPSGKVEVTETDPNGCNSELSRITVILSGTTATELMTIPGLQIFPNPTEDFCQLSAEVAINWTLTDLTGKVISSGKTSAGEKSLIDLRNYSSGTF